MAGNKHCSTILVLLALQGLSQAYPPIYMRDSEWLDDLNYSVNKAPDNAVEDGKGVLEEDLEKVAEETQEDASSRIARINDHPDLPYDIVEMDIVSPSYRRRGHIKKYKWNTTIPYSFDSSINGAKKTAIEVAMRQIAKASRCIKFVEDPSKTSRLNFVGDRRFCFAYVGKITFMPTTVSIGDLCVRNEIIVHEILHGLGFYHEQSRPDRDQYVNIYLKNVINGTQSQFAINDMAYEEKVYDFVSVMHYGRKAFSKNGRNTIEAIGDPNKELGNREGLSHTDELELQKLFCPETIPRTATAPTIVTTAAPTKETTTTTTAPTKATTVTTIAPTKETTTTTKAPTKPTTVTTTAPTKETTTTTTAPTKATTVTTAAPTKETTTTTKAPTKPTTVTTTAPTKETTTTTKAPTKATTVTTTAPTKETTTTTKAPTKATTVTTTAPTKETTTTTKAPTKETTTTTKAPTKETTTTTKAPTKATTVTTTAPTKETTTTTKVPTKPTTVTTTAPTKETTTTTKSPTKATTVTTTAPTKETTTTTEAPTKPTTVEVTTSQPTSPPTSPTLADVAQCDMENGPCQWIQSSDDAFDWRRGMARAIPRLYDHTSGVGSFMYAAARERSAGDHASMYTKFIVADGNPVCLEIFYAISQYLQEDSETHSLILQAQIANEEDPWTLADIKADQNKQWKQLLLNIEAPKGSKLRLNLTAVIGNPEAEGGVAVDDIKVYEGLCPTSTNTSSALQCSFERSICEWQQVPKAKTGAVWTRSRRRRLRAVTGFFDKYMVAIPPKENQSGKKAQQAILRSLNVSINQETCLMMYSYIRNVPGASIILNSIDVQSQISTQLLLLKNNSEGYWHDNSIMLPVKNNYMVEIVANFPANQEESEDESADPYHKWQGRRRRRRRKSALAIDNIEVLNGKCPSKKELFFCDFEVGKCNLAEAPEASCPWKRVADTSGSNGYVLSWSRDSCSQEVFDWLTGSISFLTPVGRRGSCLEFEYRIKRGSKCQFGVSMSPATSKQKRHIHKARTRYISSRNWMKAQIPLYPRAYKQIKVYFEIYFQYEDCEVMQIDRIKVSSGLCPRAELPR